jgi:hypothetical protein
MPISQAPGEATCDQMLMMQMASIRKLKVMTTPLAQVLWGSPDDFALNMHKMAITNKEMTIWTRVVQKMLPYLLQANNFL